MLIPLISFLTMEKLLMDLIFFLVLCTTQYQYNLFYSTQRIFNVRKFFNIFYMDVLPNNISIKHRSSFSVYIKLRLNHAAN